MLSRLRDAAHARQLPPCAMTFEPHPREFFAPDQAPARLTTLREKLELLASQGLERAYVLRFDYKLAQVPADEFIERVLVRGLGVRYLLVGDDFRFGARRSGDFPLLKSRAQELGYEVDAMPSVVAGGERVSSTAVRKALEQGDMARAAQLLGRPYSIRGTVVHGDALGRELGYPTANVRITHNRPPLMGIFAVVLQRAGAAPARGVASLGVRPTVKQHGEPVLEVFLLDFEGDLYGAHVRVDFLHKFRDEEKFADLYELKAKIAEDVAATREYFAGPAAAPTRAQLG
jgi:riboflavin kinase/FMN adenylyltransferase